MSIIRSYRNIMSEIIPPQSGNKAPFYCEKCEKKFYAKLRKRLFPKFSFEIITSIDASSMWKDEKCPDCGKKCKVDKWWTLTQH